MARLGAGRRDAPKRIGSGARMCAAALIGALAVSGCAREISGNVYEGATIGSAIETRLGTVESARFVEVQENDRLRDNALGQVLGGVAGGVAGSRFGQGAGKALAVGIGAVLGAGLGALLEQENSRQTGIAYVVRLDTGELLTVVQGTDVQISPGARVYVQNQQGGGRARIVPAA